MRNATKLLIALVASFPVVSAFAQSNGTVTYILTDQQGTPLAEADANGNITASFDYTPYGTIALGTSPDGPGYTGHVNDPETNLVYMQARYYDPSVGGFLSVDPGEPSSGNLFTFGRYGYASENPIGNTDPTGKYTCTVSGQFCSTVVRQLVSGVHVAFENARIPGERARLGRVIRYIGSENDHKGPTYVPGHLLGAGPALSNQVGLTTVDDSNLKRNPDGSLAPGIDGQIQGSAAIAHEAWHDLWAQDKGHTASTPDDIKDSETQAYGLTNAVLHGFGMTMTKAEMQRAIATSVYIDLHRGQQVTPQPQPSGQNTPPNVTISNNGDPNGG